MTDAAPPPPPPVLPAQPPALARLVALDLVTRFHLRLTDARDSRLGPLLGQYEMGAAGWTGPAATFVGFYTPSADPRVAGPDLAARCAAAAQWGRDRLAMQGAARADILIIALGPVPGSITPPTTDVAVNVGAIAVDPRTAEVMTMLPGPRTLPTPNDIRARARLLVQGAEAPTLAAVDLAERQAVAGGYAAPARQQLSTTPYATYGLIAAFVAFFVVEKVLSAQSNEGLALYNMGLLTFPVTDWWRVVSSAFLHDPSGGIAGLPGVFPSHLIFNCFAMFVVGRLVEQLYGRLVLVSTFLVTAIGGALLWVASNAVTSTDSVSTLGASGGIMGLLGLLVMLGRVQGRNVPAGVAHAMHSYALTYGAMVIVFGFLVPNVNNVAHIGGAITGIGVGALLPPLRRIGGRELSRWELVAVSVVFAVAAVAIACGLYNTFIDPLQLPSGA